MLTTAEYRRRFLRQLALVPGDVLDKAHVAIIGVGGLGSFVALALAKLGIANLDLYDEDAIEEHNVSNQLYGPMHLGMRKTTACKEVIGLLTEHEHIVSHTYNVDRDLLIPAPLVVTCVDSMEARAQIWQAIKGSPAVEALIDARAGAEQLRFIYAPVSEHARYETTLYSDEEALTLPCTARAIIYTAFMAGSVVASLVKAHLTRKGGRYLEQCVDIPSFQTLTF